MQVTKTVCLLQVTSLYVPEKCIKAHECAESSKGCIKERVIDLDGRVKGHTFAEERMVFAVPCHQAAGGVKCHIGVVLVASVIWASLISFRVTWLNRAEICDEI